MRLTRWLVLMVVPLSAARAQQPSPAADRLLGNWTGTLPATAAPLHLALTVTRDSAGLHGILTSIDQGNAKIPVTVLVRNDSVFANATMGIAYSAAIAGDSLRGVFTQSQRYPLTLRRVDAIPSSVRPQEPHPPFPYSSTDVSIASVPGVTLAGTLTLPPGRGPFPAVVLVTGSGPQNRDEELFGHKPFLVIADYLTRRGIAVLRYDDRGTAHSTGTFATATSVDFANDAEAAFSFLRARDDIAKAHVGLIGHSEGGLVAPMVAARNKDVGFVVMLAGPGLPGDSILLLQAALLGRASGLPPAAIERTLFVNSHLYSAVKHAPDDATASVRYDSAAAWIASTLSPAEQPIAQRQLAALKPTMLTPWIRYFVDFDPRPALRSLKIPVLALDGSLDLQVPPTEDLAQIDTALKAASNHDYRVVQIPRLNHMFQTAITGSVGEYAGIEETFSPLALQLMADWIAAHTGIKP